MTFIGWHGDPCSRCHDRAASGLVKRTATRHGMCDQCWLGASEIQRRLAAFGETYADLPSQVRFEAYYERREIMLNGLDTLPVAEPDRRLAA